MMFFLATAATIHEFDLGGDILKPINDPDPLTSIISSSQVVLAEIISYGILIWLFQSSYLCEDDVHVDCKRRASRGCCHGACGDMDPYRHWLKLQSSSTSFLYPFLQGGEESLVWVSSLVQRVLQGQGPRWLAGDDQTVRGTGGIENTVFLV